ncbi:putative oxidoreductase [Colletotrichum orbiculare MAFF 240422]|uniref:Oxidoreductase n=1 Tax=Colletotrichum orbiculare (strain 104-T / ATCC 96160 / CBS 514.97 / LARS 414 / MAFF 240422) TaxID=1213857 RepID=N4UR81_COLOR|nr:putative oxidoreductase [Colletotrichum orbiculare MAFF 240422]
MDGTIVLRSPDAIAMPQVGFGVYQIRRETCGGACLAALEAGYRHIDTAQLYGNESEVGKAVQQFMSTKDCRRRDIFITTKIGRYEGSVEKTYRSALRSVKRIAGEEGYVDLFLIHRPVPGWKEVWLALERLRSEGRTRAVGVSNFRVEELESFEGPHGPVVNQIEVHPWCQQRKLVDYCQQKGIVIQAYSPLARGKFLSDAVLARVVRKVRQRLGGSGAGGGGGGGEPPRQVTPAQVLVRWSTQKGFAPLPKSGDPSRIRENADVFWFELDAEEMEMLDGLDMGPRGALFPANVS